MATKNKKIFDVSKNDLVDIQYDVKCIIFTKSHVLRPRTAEIFESVNAVSGTIPTTVIFDYPMSPKWNYFEIQILNEGTLREMGIGVGPVDYTQYAMPGWRMGSIGYHADDGNLFHSNSAAMSGHAFGMDCHCNDTMGCGVDYSSQKHGHVTVWFTRNGELAGPPQKFPLPKDGLYPLIGMSTLNESVLYNGHSCVPPPYSEVPAPPKG